MSSVLDDVKAGAKAGAVKGAAAGALGVLGAKAADAAQSSTGNGTLKGRARKARKNVAEAAESAKKGARKASKNADVDAKAKAAGGFLHSLGDRVGDTAHDAQKNVKQATSGGLNIDIDANDVPRLLRGVALLAAGFGTLFAPGSPLDASRRRTADTGELADQTREGIDTAANVTQQRIKDVIDLTKDALSTLSDTLTSSIESAEKQAQQTLDDTGKSLSEATKDAAGSAKDALPATKKKGGSLRWLFFGLMVGGLVAFLSSPLSGPLGERVTNLRRDLGLGGDEDDDSQYWPSPPPEATGATGTETPGTGATGVENKTEAWNSANVTKEDSDKA